MINLYGFDIFIYFILMLMKNINPNTWSTLIFHNVSDLVYLLIKHLFLIWISLIVAELCICFDSKHRNSTNNKSIVLRIKSAIWILKQKISIYLRIVNKLCTTHSRYH